MQSGRRGGEHMSAMSADRFLDVLAVAGIDLDLHTFPAGTRTAEDAARAVGCDPAQIVKSLVFLAGGRAVVALVSGRDRVDPERLAAAAGSRVRRADPDAVRAATGYAIGAVPPFGHLTPLPVHMDDALLAHEVVWAAGGRPDRVFPVAPARLRELSGATVARLRA